MNSEVGVALLIFISLLSTITVVCIIADVISESANYRSRPKIMQNKKGHIDSYINTIHHSTINEDYLDNLDDVYLRDENLEE